MEAAERKKLAQIEAHLQSLKTAEEQIEHWKSVRTIMMEQATENLNLDQQAIEALLLERRNHNGE